MSREPDVLHLTAHLGGGVGRVLLSYLAALKGRPGRRRLYCLDYANDMARAVAEEHGLELHDRQSGFFAALDQAVNEADVVVLHWWNHPLTYQWLCRALPPARLLLWSHVSGLSLPNPITPALAAFADIFAAASPVSFRLPALAALSEQPRLIFSSAGIDHVGRPSAISRPGPGKKFRIGYLGTVDYGKMHPDFIDLCLSAHLDDAIFIVAGGPGHQQMRAEIQRRGLLEKFEILGPITDIGEFFASIDVFGYPLNPDHYGTGEQVLIEAQAAGVPAVVLGGGAEEFVVADGISGLTAPTADDYGPCLARLHRDPKLRRRLAGGGRQRAESLFGLDKTIKAFDRVYGEIMERPKRARIWPGAESGPLPPWRLFQISQGQDFTHWLEEAEGKSRLEPPHLPLACFSETRGSVFHYRSFFPKDARLARWAAIIDSLRTGN